jgi:hypothetical protein
MRDPRPTALALLLLAALAGCGDDNPAPTTPAVSSETADAAAVIPDGSYAKTVTVDQAKAMGITDKSFLRQLGEDETTSFVYKFQGDRWTQFVVEGAPEPGDLGPLEYDANDDVVMTSESDGCPGCVYSYDWSLDGDRLTLTLVGHDSTDTPEDVVIVRFITEGTFTRQP